MITLKIAEPTKQIFDGSCARVEIKTSSGNITVLPKHVPLISTIANGYVKIDGATKIDITKGLCIVGENSTVDIIISDL